MFKFLRLKESPGNIFFLVIPIVSLALILVAIKVVLEIIVNDDWVYFWITLILLALAVSASLPMYRLYQKSISGRKENDQ
jgi:hypothetical protein